MHEANLRRTLAGGVLAVAVFGTLAALTDPRAGHRPALPLVSFWAALLLVHAAGYWYADRVRARIGDARYMALQTLLVFTLGMSGALFPVAVTLYVALTTYAVIIAGRRWGTVPITFGAIVVFAANAILTSNVYRGATAGLLLAAAGVVGHAVAALFRPRDETVTAAPGVPAERSAAPLPAAWDRFGLTPREAELLEALTRGARNSDLAAAFGISERTVKAHLGRVYAKLGVDSRAAAIAMALREKQGAEGPPA